jgi:RNase adaptor protein for sRNA GlmZ degradation
MSHGFKFGAPKANFVFDVSYFKNPWREERLRNGSREDIMNFMHEQKEFDTIVEITLSLTCMSLTTSLE